MKVNVKKQRSTSIASPRFERRCFFCQPLKILGCVIGIVSCAFTQTVMGDPNPDPALRIVVYNYSQATASVLAGAEREAARILRKAGLQVVWLQCPVVQVTDDVPARCQDDVVANDIRLRILRAAVGNTFNDTVFGYAIHPVLASVYYEKARHLAMLDDAEFETPIILGCVIAHEVGHLLLRSNNHSGTGIMQRKWQRLQIRHAMMGTLVFPTEQSKVIRAEAQRRTLATSAGLP